jgi:hypothetical protein
VRRTGAQQFFVCSSFGFTPGVFTLGFVFEGFRARPQKKSKGKGQNQFKAQGLLLIRAVLNCSGDLNAKGPARAGQKNAKT